MYHFQRGSNQTTIAVRVWICIYTAGFYMNVMEALNSFLVQLFADTKRNPRRHKMQ